MQYRLVLRSRPRTHRGSRRWRTPERDGRRTISSNFAATPWSRGRRQDARLRGVDPRVTAVESRREPPTRDRRQFANNIRGRVASGEFVAAQERRQGFVQRFPWGRAADVIRAPLIAESVRKSPAQNPHEPQVEAATEINDFLLVAVDEFAAQFPMLLCSRCTGCSHTAAGIGPCVQQRNGGPCANKFVSGREARQPCSSNDDAKTVHGRAREQWKCHL